MKLLILSLWRDRHPETATGPPEIGHLLDASVGRGWDVTVVCPKGGDGVDEGVTFLRASALSFSLLGPLFRLLTPLEPLARTLAYLPKTLPARNGVDLVVSYSGYLAPLALLVARLVRVPVLYRQFGVKTSLTGRPWLFRLLENVDVLLSYLLPGALFTDDDGSGGGLLAKKLGRRGVFRLLPHPRPDWRPQGRAEARRRLGLPDAPTFGFVGALDPIKGSRHLTRIAPAVLRAMRTSRVVIVGSGPDEKRVRAALGPFGERVTFAGGIPHGEIAPWIESLDVLMALSVYANGTLQVIEAMSLGVVPVAFDLVETDRCIGDGVSGTLIPPFDTAGFAGEVVSLLIDENRRDKLAEGAVKAASLRPGWKERIGMELDETERLV